MEEHILIRLGRALENIKIWLVLSFIAPFFVVLYVQVIGMLQLGVYEHVVLIIIFISGTIIFSLMIQVGALGIGKLLVLLGEGVSLPKRAKFNIATKELNFRETKQEKVILLELTNQEWMLDATEVKIGIDNIVNMGDDLGKSFEQLSLHLWSGRYKLLPRNIVDQKADSLGLNRTETKPFYFLETRKESSQFYIKIDPRSRENDSDLIGGFSPGNYKINFSVSGDMPKRQMLAFLYAIIFYNGGNQLYVKEIGLAPIQL